MTSNQDLVRFQADKHEIVCTENFGTIEEYCLFLIHVKAYEEAARLAQDKFALDIGCNNGYGTMILSNTSKKVVGVDVSLRAIKKAVLSCRSRNVEFQLGDAAYLPFKGGSFDLVTSFQVIEHIADYSTFLGEVKRVLKPRGKVLFTSPNALIRLSPDMKPWNPFHTREFSAGELRKLLETYFPDVRLRGLSAKEPLYSIEVNRINREKARGTARRMFSLGTKLRTILPSPVRELIRVGLDGIKYMTTKGSDISFLQDRKSVV